MISPKHFLLLLIFMCTSLSAAAPDSDLIEGLPVPTKAGDTFHRIMDPIQEKSAYPQVFSHNLECLIRSPELAEYDEFIADLRTGQQTILGHVSHANHFATLARENFTAFEAQKEIALKCNTVAEHNAAQFEEQKKIALKCNAVAAENFDAGNKYYFLRNSLLPQVALSGLVYFFAHKLATANAKAFSRESRPRLYEMCEKLCEKAGLPKPQLYLLSGPYMNAMTTGGRNNFVILISQALLDNLTENEIEAIISHEIGHTLLGHASSNIMWGFFVGVATTLVLAQFHKQSKDTHPFVDYLETSAIFTLVTSLATATKSRMHEKEADMFSAHLCKKPLALASGLEKLEAFNTALIPKTIFDKLPQFKLTFLENIFRSHPRTDDRVTYLKHWATEKQITV